MQVYFNNFSNIKYQNFKGSNNTVSPLILQAENKIISAGAGIVEKNLLQSEFIAHTNIKKITSEEEFDRVLNKLKNDKSWRKGWWDRGSATKFEQAIIPYTGEEDRSSHINWYMHSGHLVDPLFSEDITREYIRAMYYALPEIDKVYGKYSGIVYRCGHMDEVPKNFISTASDPVGVSYIISSREDYHKPFYIIYTESGHLIQEMQKKLCWKYARECEVILDPDTHFEKITEITPEMLELKRNLRNAIRDEYAVPELNVTFLKEKQN